MSNGGAVDRWLRHALLALVAVLLALLCVFVWRLSMVALQVERSIAALSADVGQVAGTAARLATQLDGVLDRVDAIEERAHSYLDTDRLAAVLDHTMEAMDTADAGTAGAADSDREIAYLLSRIGQRGLEYEYSGKSRSSSWGQLKMANKYALWRFTVGSADEFIEKIAATRLNGDPYYVIEEGGEKRELKGWLEDALRDYRAQEAGQEADDELSLE